MDGGSMKDRYEVRRIHNGWVIWDTAKKERHRVGTYEESRPAMSLARALNASNELNRVSA